MAALICLLRGVNVGGHNKLKMDALRELCESLELRNVQTYVQSGNVVFDAPVKGLETLGGRLASAIEKSFGFRPGIVLRTAAELEQTIARNPFAGRAEVEPNKLLVVFFDAEPEAGKVAALKPADEEFHHAGRELYIYFPKGQGQSKLSFAPFDRGAAKVVWTGRNWNTITKLLEMATAAGSGSRKS
jgi:uncharacterized protein (DUF1697 family)